MPARSNQGLFKYRFREPLCNTTGSAARKRNATLGRISSSDEHSNANMELEADENMVRVKNILMPREEAERLRPAPANPNEAWHSYYHGFSRDEVYDDLAAEFDARYAAKSDESSSDEEHEEVAEAEANDSNNNNDEGEVSDSEDEDVDGGNVDGGNGGGGGDGGGDGGDAGKGGNGGNAGGAGNGGGNDEDDDNKDDDDDEDEDEDDDDEDDDNDEDEDDDKDNEDDDKDDDEDDDKFNDAYTYAAVADTDDNTANDYIEDSDDEDAKPSAKPPAKPSTYSNYPDPHIVDINLQGMEAEVDPSIQNAIVHLMDKKKPISTGIRRTNESDMRQRQWMVGCRRELQWRKKERAPR